MIKSLSPSPATASGLFALGVGATALVAGTATDADANVLVYTSGLTTSIAPNSNVSSGNDVFFDFVSGTSSKTAFAGYQYRLNTTTNSAYAYQNGTSNLIANDNMCGAVRYNAGDLIGSGSTYNGTLSQPIASPPFGNFTPGTSGYLGFAFTQSGNTFYGSANIKVNNNYTVTLNSFGNETTPSTALLAGSVTVPEANPLELLLLGAVGMGAYRAAQNRRPKAA